MNINQIKDTTVSIGAGEMIIEKITNTSLLLKAKQGQALVIILASIAIPIALVFLMSFLAEQNIINGALLEKSILAVIASGFFGIVSGLNTINKVKIGFYFSKNWIIVNAGTEPINLKFSDVNTLDITRVQDSYDIEFPDSILPKITITDNHQQTEEYPPLVQFFIKNIKKYNKSVIINTGR